MEYGIFTSNSIEIAQTRSWTLCLYCNHNKTILSAELYNGIDENKILMAIVRRNNKTNSTLYAYKTHNGQIVSNDENGIKTLIGQKYAYSTYEMKRNDTVYISEPYEMPIVSANGIDNCLKQWRMGTFYFHWANIEGMLFQMVTNKVEYVFSIQDENCNIYCGASVNIPRKNGMLGTGQYFRIRNYGDNSQPFCRFECNLGNDITLSKSSAPICENGTCNITEHGIFWPVKNFNEDIIVLSGCNGDEYVYTRNNEGRSEYFICND